MARQIPENLRSASGQPKPYHTAMRSESIKFMPMADGRIRAFDSRKGSGVSEWQTITPKCVSPTITTCAQHIKILLTDEAIRQAVFNTVL